MKQNCYKKKELKELEKVIDFLKIISDSHRIEILCFLKGGKKCVCEIWQHLKIPQNLTSHHLKVLKEFKLLSSKKEGLKVFYFINKKVVNRYLILLNKFLKV